MIQGCGLHWRLSFTRRGDATTLPRCRRRAATGLWRGDGAGQDASRGGNKRRRERDAMRKDIMVEVVRRWCQGGRCSFRHGGGGAGPAGGGVQGRPMACAAAYAAAASCAADRRRLPGHHSSLGAVMGAENTGRARERSAPWGLKTVESAGQSRQMGVPDTAEERASHCRRICLTLQRDRQGRD